MNSRLDELVQLLGLEKLEENLFRGQSQDLGWGVVFGGQVLGQALSAAAQTVPAERPVHSLHSYFLRPGDVGRPIVYDVDRIRDGGSFTTRRVVAIQGGEAIFNLSVSFQAIEPGFEHQDEMPLAPSPDSLVSEAERLRPYRDRLPGWLRGQAMAEFPFEMKMVDAADDPVQPVPRAPTRLTWLRARGQLPATPALHAYLLAYASDFSFVTTALLPHGISWLTGKLQIASLDHVMWFHQQFRVDEWLLYVMDSPAAHGGRGLARGRIFTQGGKLVASTMQEGLMRARRSSK
jgi:acyl-CoA thioesterase-2